MKTRCKFRVRSVLRAEGRETVKLDAQYSDSPEDRTFSSATPNGHLEFDVTNTEAIGRFNPGDEYYLDLIPVG